MKRRRGRRLWVDHVSVEAFSHRDSTSVLLHLSGEFTCTPFSPAVPLVNRQQEAVSEDGGEGSASVGENEE